ncbi:hypothetical protein [Paenibacillus tyrfis]|uniref:hypothetical protein n=1 Tax=Paenibacillus tyrfis TaxID=1501230 RepID=UPI00209CBF79|nr:hypothetical protein [Paenibacillus tyrfis]MCP1309601.1 hypothetical protein [Paenibacillus tyrfis]
MILTKKLAVSKKRGVHEAAAHPGRSIASAVTPALGKMGVNAAGTLFVRVAVLHVMEYCKINVRLFFAMLVLDVMLHR